MALKIVVLNQCFFSHHQLMRLRNIGCVTLYHDTDSEEKTIQRLCGATIAVANGLFTPLTKKVFNATDHLRLLVINSTGFDFVDMEAALKRGVEVANVPGFSTEAVSEHVFALALAVIRKITLADQAVRRVFFEINPSVRKSKMFLGSTLCGKTLGIVGLGTIGKRVAQLGMAFGMSIIAYNRTVGHVYNVRMVSLKELLQKSDVISLHLALSPETKKIISTREFGFMKPSSIIINTARGGLMDTGALIKALKLRRIFGAGLDVVDGLMKKRSILRLNTVVFSPHCGWWAQESLEWQSEIIVQNIEAFVKGKPINIVSTNRKITKF